MSRDPKPPRLWYRKPRKAGKGRSAENGTWIILHGGRQISTGCGQGDTRGAEAALAAYIAQRHVIPRKRRTVDEIPIADVLNLYLRDVVPDLATARKAAGRIERLLEFWGSMTLGEVTRSNCKTFAAAKGNGAARRELQDLQAAINHHHREGLHLEAVLVTLPPAGERRERWLTPSEAAKLIRICLHVKEIQNSKPTGRRPLRHLARFIIFALHTGSRPGDILSASFYRGVGRGYIDLENGLFYRKPTGKLASKKLQPTTPLSPPLLVHLRRWKRLGADYVVEFDGRPVKSIKTAFNRLLTLANLAGDVVIYTLRHTCVTWAMQAGETHFDVGKYVGTSAPMIDRHYGHHDPDHLRGVAKAITQRRPNKHRNSERDSTKPELKTVQEIQHDSN